MLQTSGQTLTSQNSTIDVTPPDSHDPYGSRTVTVAVTYDMINPIPIAGFISGFGGNSDTSNLSEIPVSASASMRFEE